MTFYSKLDGPRGVATAEAELAARWVVEMDNGPERSRLLNGHRIRRVEGMKDGYRNTDHSEADAWLVEEWQAATHNHVWPERTLEDTALEFTCSGCNEVVTYW